MIRKIVAAASAAIAVASPAILAVPSGCSLIDSNYELCGQLPQSARPRDQNGSQRQKGSGAGSDSPGTALADTVIWVSALEFPESYDWRKDSSYGAVDARLLLFRNGIRVLEIPARGNASPDGHHIIGGHLFSEYYDSGGNTRFLRDGTEYLKVQGKRSLAGLLEKDGTTYRVITTYGLPGFTLYKDTDVMLVKDRGKLQGEFGEPQYAGTGALYEDNGHVVLCYSVGSSPGCNWYIVEDGVERQGKNLYFSATSLRLVDGTAVSVPGYGGTFTWTSAAVWNQNGIVTAGQSGDRYIVRRPSGDSYINTDDPDARIYLSGQSQAAVSWSAADATVTVFRDDGPGEVLDGKWSYVYPSCGLMAGKRLFLALTPAEDSSAAVILCDGAKTETRFHGFFTNVSMTEE